MPRLPLFQVRFHVTISLLVLLVVVGTAGLALAVVVQESWKAARETAQTHFAQLAIGVGDRLDVLLNGLESHVDLLAGQPQTGAAMAADGRDHPAFPLFRATLQAVPGLYSVYVGDARGQFLQVIAPRRQDSILAAHGAPDGTALIVRSIVAQDGGGRVQTWLFLDGLGALLRRDQESVVDFDPRRRPWFVDAVRAAQTVLSTPYLFHSLQAPGITASRRLAGGAVVGADLTLQQLQDFLNGQWVSEQGGIVVFDGRTRLMAASGAVSNQPPPLTELRDVPAFPFPLLLGTQPAPGMALRRQVLRGHGADAIEVAVFAPEADFTGRFDRMRQHILMASVGLSALGLALAWWLARQIVRPVARLADAAQRARAWDFDTVHDGASFIAEIGTLAEGFALMRRSLVEALERNPAGVVICAADGAVEYANPAYLQAVGAADLAPLRGRPLALSVGEGQPPCAYPALWGLAEDGTVWRGECQSRRLNGSLMWESVVVTPVRDDSGAILHFIGVHQDVTDKKAHHDELGRLVAHLSDANAELERFAYVASHDLREPLRTVSTFLQLLRKRFGGQMGGEADEFIDYAVQGAQRMDALVNDLLAYSRVSSPGQALSEVDSRRACDEAVQNLRDALDAAQAQVRVGDLPVVHGEPVQLMQLFQNLIGNAVKFRADDRLPVVTVAYDGLRDGFHHFSVADNGIGVEASDQDIFEVFRRLHGQGRYPGTGIGLAICKRVAQRHGGRIWYEANPQGGTVFRFTLAERPGDFSAR